MTTLLADIRRFDPFFVGFDQLFDRLASFDAKETLRPTNFPPYNIVKKEFYDIHKINNIDFTTENTQTITKERSFVYSFLSSIRQKINKPVKKKK